MISCVLRFGSAVIRAKSRLPTLSIARSRAQAGNNVCFSCIYTIGFGVNLLVRPELGIEKKKVIDGDGIRRERLRRDSRTGEDEVCGRGRRNGEILLENNIVAQFYILLPLKGSENSLCKSDGPHK